MEYVKGTCLKTSQSLPGSQDFNRPRSREAGPQRRAGHRPCCSYLRTPGWKLTEPPRGGCREAERQGFWRCHRSQVTQMGNTGLQKQPRLEGQRSRRKGLIERWAQACSGAHAGERKPRGQTHGSGGHSKPTSLPAVPCGASHWGSGAEQRGKLMCTGHETSVSARRFTWPPRGGVSPVPAPASPGTLRRFMQLQVLNDTPPGMPTGAPGEEDGGKGSRGSLVTTWQRLRNKGH